jgi:DNA invertase Pin-like site-specific DNA recombinase
MNYEQRGGIMKAKSKKQFVAYYRVSTDKQGASGLGMQSQRKAVGEYIAAASGVLVEEFIEVESGRKSNRPELIIRW